MKLINNCHISARQRQNNQVIHQIKWLVIILLLVNAF